MRNLLAGGALAAVAGAGLLSQSVSSLSTVAQTRDVSAHSAARADNAFYACVTSQARQLIPRGAPVVIGGDAPVYITLFKALGSWVHVAPSPALAAGTVSLLQVTPGTGTCRSYVVTWTVRGNEGHAVVHIGHGATAVGTGPPPPTPL